jgi:formylglycine-generating enzyme required for sulfatase activity
MRKLRVFFSLLLTGMIILGACNLPAGTQAPIETDQPPTETEPPTLTEVPIEPTLTPTLVPLDLSGPPMEVGSKYPYVDGSVLVAVPGGEFTMGHGGEDNPEHIVNISSFWIYRAKVTNSQYAFCVSVGECTPPDLEDNVDYGDLLNANHPVVGVNHPQSAAYCEFVHGRLPTEAEWEKTARGPEGNIYPWGDANPSCDLLNASNCVRKTTSVVDYPQGQSYYEALDMAGNAYEWVADWYSRTYYGASPVDDPLGPELGQRRSVRSNGFISPSYESESARRFSARPEDHRSDLGFRCVVEDPPTYFAPFCELVPTYGQNANNGLPVSDSYSESCPKVGITQNQSCNGRVPVTNVTFSGPADATKSPNGCTPTGDPNLFICGTTGVVSITAGCQQNLPGDPTCPPGFTKEGKICVAQGRPGNCLAGYTYDKVRQCCTTSPGQNTSVELPLCPLGTYYMEDKQACVPYPPQGIVSAVQTIGLLDCTPRGGNGTTPVACINPKQYTDPKACQNAGCTWVTTTRVPYCDY